MAGEDLEESVEKEKMRQIEQLQYCWCWQRENATGIFCKAEVRQTGEGFKISIMLKKCCLNFVVGAMEKPSRKECVQVAGS